MFENPVFLELGTFPQSPVMRGGWPGSQQVLGSIGDTDCGPDLGARDGGVGWKDT